ncbi:tRNA (adenosine(37)-N6)-dimethylallyltransferase MiaA [Patescibacteria group bacterium]|nr:MAG: tRNA (adenosine(37)-N6)-dimethylallyltransferase MiaA [Patescibacteria group bacterium]
MHLFLHFYDSIATTMKKKVVVVVGSTAVGKSDIAVAIATACNGEVVSADSRQVYTGLDIGTGKITPKEMRGIPHHLLDVADAKDVFTAHDFVVHGRIAINDIVNRNKLPVIAGGTGFYIDALLGVVSLPEVPENLSLRKELSQLSTEELYSKLETLDSERAKTIDAKNKVRLVRAIEIAMFLGGVPPLKEQEIFDVLYVGISLPSELLYEKIKNRLKARAENGMIEEVKNLHKRGLSYERMESLGLEYRYIARFLKKELSYEKMMFELEKEIVKYAKRQKTWFKKNIDIQWFEPTEVEKILTEVQRFVQN